MPQDSSKASRGRASSPRPPNAVVQLPRAQSSAAGSGEAANTNAAQPVMVPSAHEENGGGSTTSARHGQQSPRHGAAPPPAHSRHAAPALYAGQRSKRSVSMGAEAYPGAAAADGSSSSSSNDNSSAIMADTAADRGQGHRGYAASKVSDNRAVSYHPGVTSTADQPHRDSGSGNASDIERRASMGGAGAAGGSSSSDIVLQGRSYRFQPHADHMAALSSPYTATSSSIRDNTALLAGMLLQHEDGSSPRSVQKDRIDERPEDEEATTSRSSPTSPIAISGFKRSPDLVVATPIALSPSPQDGASKGPSNLSRAMLASSSSSPATIKQAVNAKSSLSEAENVNADTRLASAPVVDEGKDTEVSEDTPLLSSALQGRRGRRRSSADGPEAGSRESSATKSHSRSRTKSPAPDHSGFSAFSGRGSGSAAATVDGKGQSGSSAYGYGALAQASQPQRDARVSFVEPEEDSSEDGETLSPAWAVIPKCLRPGRKSIPPRAFTITQNASKALIQARKLTWKDTVEASKEPVRLLPAVILGVLLNVLDGVSYGLIIFPTSYGIFSDFGGDGVSMFFVTCIISQLVYTLGGSIFKGGNGSMMIEVVPFYHILVTIIIDLLGEDQPVAVISTTMVAFALSSIFAGIVFLALGYFRLGVLIGFFPRHILVGCIGGVGVFLIETGLEVSAQLKSEAGFQWDLETFHYFTQSWLMVAHWLPPFALAVLLRVITSRFHHPLIFPAYFLILPVIFFIMTRGALGVPIAELRRNDWIFDVGKAAQAPFWRFYTYFDFSQTSWSALWATMPTQLALTFFAILHVPLNVPALAVSVNEDNLDTDRELLAHGISNIAAGFAGSVPNYLCYVNSVLFYRVGGGSRLSGLMLAAGTFAIFLAGPGAIGYLPIMVVGALIFVLGIDLTKEAIWDTIGRVNAWEYFTIWLIIFVMTYYDFVMGILSGIVVACFFFVIQTSRRRTVRAVLDGSIARSTVRRHTTQRHFLDRVGQQTQIVKLQGFLYFATISSVEELIRRALDIAQWQEHPIRFLMVDFSLVNGVDFSAAEAFTRIQRLLQAKDVLLIFCGLTPDSDVGVALRSVDLWAGSDIRLEVFQNLNEALEWTENEYLRSMYLSGLASAKSLRLGHRGALDMPNMKRAPAFSLGETFENSPRRQHLFDAAHEASRASDGAHNLTRGLESDQSFEDTTTTTVTSKGQRRISTSSQSAPHLLGQGRAQPYSLLVTTFQAWITERHTEAFFAALAPYFRETRLLRGEMLWDRGDASDNLYLIESGVLKARYDFPQEDYEINESMLAGTIAGELTFLSRTRRNTTAYADLDCTLWTIDRPEMTRLRNEHPDVHDNFIQLLLCAGSEEQEGLMSYLVSRLS